mgnify:CR=1 FL=1|jgi:hypothetical protein
MILSSADILRILGRSEIIRLSAKLSIVDSRPNPSGAEGLFIFIERFPVLGEFEATWRLWLESDGSEPDDLVIAEIKKLLPNVTVSDGLLVEVTTTDFRSENTQVVPRTIDQSSSPLSTVRVELDLTAYENRFQALVESVQDQMLLVGPGQPGKDGQQGPAGKDGRNGIDLVATEVDLEDLRNVEQGIPFEKGQVLTWDGEKWTNLFIPKTLIFGGGSTVNSSSSSEFVSSTVQWKYHGANISQDPASGDFNANSSVAASVTNFYVSNHTTQGTDISVLLRDLLSQGYDRLYAARSNDLSQAQLYAIASHSETPQGFLIQVAHVETAGTEPNFIVSQNYQFFISKSAAAGGGGIPEAPIDNSYYIRRNGTWANSSSMINEVLLGDLADIDTTSKVDGSVLCYNSGSGKWVGGNITTVLTLTDGGNF